MLVHLVFLMKSFNWIFIWLSETDSMSIFLSSSCLGSFKLKSFSSAETKRCEKLGGSSVGIP